MTTTDKLADAQFVLSVSRAKLFDYLHSAKDADEAMRLAGSRIITSLLSEDAGFAEMVVMEMAGIGFSPSPAPSDALREENARLRAALTILTDHWNHGHLWSGDSRHETINAVERFASAALSTPTEERQ